MTLTYVTSLNCTNVRNKNKTNNILVQQIHNVLLFNIATSMFNVFLYDCVNSRSTVFPKCLDVLKKS